MTKVRLATFFLVLCAMFLPAPLVAANANINIIGPNGDFVGTDIQSAIDWSKGVVQATGIGLPPERTSSPAQANAMARRAAVLDAYRNLLEEVGKVRVEASATVKNYEVESDIVRTKISGLVQDARVVSGQAMPDGSYQVTMRINLFGDNSVAVAIEDQMKPEPILPVPAPTPDYQNSSSVIITPLYTGLVIDASGLGLEGVMSPRIYDETGRIIYSNMYIDPNMVVHKGMVDYLHVEDMAAVTAGASRAGSTPIIVKAVGLRDFNANVVISRTDADMILSANAKTNFLARTAVVFAQ